MKTCEPGMLMTRMEGFIVAAAEGGTLHNGDRL